MESTGKRIKQALQLLKMKQTELASLLNVSRGTVSNYIADRYSPSPELNDRLAEVLNVSSAWLAGFDVPMVRDLGLDTKTLQSAQSEVERIKIAYISADEKIQRAIRVLLELE